MMSVPQPATPILGIGGKGRAFTRNKPSILAAPHAPEAPSVVPVLMWSISVTLPWRSSQPAVIEAMITTLLNGAVVKLWARLP